MPRSHRYAFIQGEDRRVPVTIVTGFLGSGKTTLLNHILDDPNHGVRFAVIQNEFDVSIDNKLLTDKVVDELIEVTNCCFRCSIRGGLIKALKRLYRKIKNFDAIIIETNGMSDPAAVAQTFFTEEEINTRFFLDSIITVIDSKNIIPRLDEQKPEGVVNEVVQQIAFADKILVNKTDLVDHKAISDIEARILRINLTAKTIRCCQSQVEPLALVNTKAFTLKNITTRSPGFFHREIKTTHDPSIDSVSLSFPGCLNMNMLKNFVHDLIENLGFDLFRYKGVLNIAGMDFKFVFQGVGFIFNGNYSERWPHGEERKSSFVFVGRNLKGGKLALTDCFLSCICSPVLRFRLGEEVLARTGRDNQKRTFLGRDECHSDDQYHDQHEDPPKQPLHVQLDQEQVEEGWTRGRIIKLWDEGNPYRIELIDEERSNVWGPIDSDLFVKKAQ
ncbi:hypothetical protein TrVE_jg8094 [Triparma verrucosa]|uniref:CobW C-terminal domain-containing protein n=1 Tax=Triparma verrucosa TaxID=1606542 RepID=A0A9W7CLE9_9STRA|nr:hypothetical protein TrVE_jg8094 [Triparma verrucosa]